MSSVPRLDASVQITVGILTYNSSIATVESTLRSISDFTEVIVCDGRSTDGTRDLAVALGCRVIDQAEEFLDAKGRLIDEAGVLDQLLAAASNDWLFVLDHDELATPALVEEMRAVAAGLRTCGAYLIPRLYTLDGTVIDCASVYPRYQVRLVHCDAVRGYTGLVHSTVLMRDDEATGTLQQPMLVPLPPQRELWPKWRGYLRLEEVNQSGLTRAEWVAQILRPKWKYAKWIAWRTVKVRRSCEGTPLPLRYEFSRLLVELATIVYTGRRFVGLGRSDARGVWR